MMKRILSAVLAMLLALSMLPAFAETTDDLSTPFYAAPITLQEYRDVFQRMMVENITPDFEQYDPWQLVTLEGGHTALANGQIADGVYNIALTVEGSYVKSIRIAWLYEMSNPQESYGLYFTWCMLGAIPLLMRDGIPFDVALEMTYAELGNVVSSTAEAGSMCGMQAVMGVVVYPGMEDTPVLTMTYTFHREPEILPTPSGKDLTALSAEEYMRAMDDYALSHIGEPLRWTTPEEWLGCTLIGVDSLGDTPALMIIDDQIALLTTLARPISGDVAETYSFVKGLTFLTLVPLLTADGMTEEEAIAAVEAWWLEAHFTARIISALSGVPTRTSFYGYTMTVDMLEDGTVRLQLATPLASQIDLSQLE